jgi:UDP-glucose 4-epimerase
MSKILITGGAGYIGTHTIVELQQAGYEIIIVDNLSNSSQKSLEGVEKITGKKCQFHLLDMCNYNDLKNIFVQNHDIESIIHFAAYKAAGESYQKPMMYFENNLFSMINLLKVMSEYKKTINLVFSSSCTVYGDPNYLPVDENHPFNQAISPYGRTKQICEKLIEDTLKVETQIKAISLRYFNPIGGHASGIIGESPKVPNNLIPALSQTATGKLKELLVFGNDYPTVDGSGVRDYIHVVDLAKAHLAAIKKLEQNDLKSNYNFYNIGVGKGFSVLEIIKTFEKVSEKKINYKIVERRKGDIAEIYADAQLAKKELNWQAESTLEDMLRTAWLWESKYRNY